MSGGQISPHTQLQSLNWQTQLLTYRGGGRRENRGRERVRRQGKQQREERREEAQRVETPQSTEEAVAKKIKS